VPHMPKGGAVINTTSVNADTPKPTLLPYAATKGAIQNFTGGLAQLLAEKGIRVNCVAPGPIDTAWTHKETGAVDAKVEKALLSSVPFGRRGTPAEVANVYAFLASDDASYVTGAVWLVDGGTTPAKSAVGGLARREISKPPANDLDLHHSHEGLKDKELVKIS